MQSDLKLECSPIQCCVCCGRADLRKYLDLGLQPLANDFRKRAYTVEECAQLSYPLGLSFCQGCWHSQLTHCVDRAAMFSDYAYASATSRTLKRYFDWFAACLSAGLATVGVEEHLGGIRSVSPDDQAVFALKDHSDRHFRVLEVAANDGSLIRALRAQGIDAIGVDPAVNLVHQAQSEGLPIVLGTWPESASRVADFYQEAESAGRIRLKNNGLTGHRYPGFDVIVCLNVLAHVCQPLDFLTVCRAHLNPGGVVIVQTSQARMLSRGEFDTCYHEHVSFFNSYSMHALAERAGLSIIKTLLVDIHGDSALWFLGAKGAPCLDVSSAFSVGDFFIDEDLRGFEVSIGVSESNTYESFAEKTQVLIERLRNIVYDYKRRGHEIVFVGAAAKAITMLHATGVVPDRLVDEAPLKIDTFPPALDVRVEALASLQTLRRPALFVISAWNFLDELKRKICAVGVPSQSVFYSYFPSERLVGVEETFQESFRKAG